MYYDVTKVRGTETKIDKGAQRERRDDNRERKTRD
jgi:hypothetical protein